MSALASTPTPLRAVVIDGDARHLDLAMARCRQAGIIVNGWSSDGAAALELIESLPAPPDLVIMDMDLPDIDGADLLQALSMLQPGLPVIITSRHSQRLLDAALTLAATLGLKALAALPKPIAAPSLLAAAQSCEPAAKRACAVPRRDNQPPLTPKPARS